MPRHDDRYGPGPIPFELWQQLKDNPLKPIVVGSKVTNKFTRVTGVVKRIYDQGDMMGPWVDVYSLRPFMKHSSPMKYWYHYDEFWPY